MIAFPQSTQQQQQPQFPAGVTRPDHLIALQRVCHAWRDKIQAAKKSKRHFSKVAEICVNFLSGTGDFVSKTQQIQDKSLVGDWVGAQHPGLHVQLNKAFEFVSIYGPATFNQNPHKRVTPRDRLKLPDAMWMGNPQIAPFIQQMRQQQQVHDAQSEARAMLMEAALNYASQENPGGGFAKQTMLAVNEALITGLGLLWTEPFAKPRGVGVLPATTYDSCSNFLIDPDAGQIDFESCWWIAKRVRAPIWKVLEEFPGVREEDLRKAVAQGAAGGGENVIDKVEDANRWRDRTDQERTNEMVTYYKIYSRMGAGARLQGFPEDSRRSIEGMGRYAYLCIAENVDYPLNLPPQVFARGDRREIDDRVRWPIPTWMDARWPVTCISFWTEPNDPWPIAPLKPGLGEMISINVIMSHLLARTIKTSRDIIACLSTASEQLTDALEGRDSNIAGVDLVPISATGGGQGIKDLVTMLSYPQINADVWSILTILSDWFDKRVGLTELAYGETQRQIRSAHEADLRMQQISSRPEYMASRVEESLTSVVAKEALCLRWYTTAQTVQPLLGNEAAFAWQELVTTQDPNAVAQELDYFVAAGTTRRPNKQRDQANVMNLMNVLVPILGNYATQTGNSDPLNKFFELWSEANDFKLDGLQLGPWAPPPPPPGTPNPEEEKLKIEQAKAQLKMQLDAQKAALDRERMEMQVAMQANQLKGDQTRTVYEMLHDAQSHEQEIRQDEEVHDQEMRQRTAEGRQKLALAEQQAAFQRRQAAQRQRAASTNGSS